MATGAVAVACGVRRVERLYGEITKRAKNRMTLYLEGMLPLMRGTDGYKGG